MGERRGNPGNHGKSWEDRGGRGETALRTAKAPGGGRSGPSPWSIFGLVGAEERRLDPPEFEGLGDP